MGLFKSLKKVSRSVTSVVKSAEKTVNKIQSGVSKGVTDVTSKIDQFTSNPLVQKAALTGAMFAVNPALGINSLAIDAIPKELQNTALQLINKDPVAMVNTPQDPIVNDILSSNIRQLSIPEKAIMGSTVQLQNKNAIQAASKKAAVSGGGSIFDVIFDLLGALLGG